MKKNCRNLESAAGALMDAVHVERFGSAQDILAEYRSRLDETLEAELSPAEQERLLKAALEVLTSARRLTQLYRAHNMHSELQVAGARQYGCSRGTPENRRRAIG